MLENSLLRFLILTTLMMLLAWMLRRFFSGWSAEAVQVDADERSFADIDEEPQFRVERPEARIQQPLEAPEPDSLMAEPARPQHDIARRIRADSQAIDSMQPARPTHRRPQRNSRPARVRKIQL